MEEAAKPVKQVLVIRKDLHMRRGKEIAQGAHASMAWLTSRITLDPEDKYPWLHGQLRLSPAEAAWVRGGFRKICCTVQSERELLDIYAAAGAARLTAELIQDSGLTEFSGVPTYTAVAVGPDYDEKIDPVTVNLALY